MFGARSFQRLSTASEFNSQIIKEINHLRATRLLPAVAITAIALAPGSRGSASDNSEGIIASFEGRWVNLADSWEEARACTTDSVTARCYRSEVEMDAVEEPGDADVARACSPSVRLWNNTGQTGLRFQVTAQYVHFDLAPAGFNNIASSYTIGACNSAMYSGGQHKCGGLLLLDGLGLG